MLHVAGKLYDGSAHFAKARSTRRPICACVAESCDGIERGQVRKYVAGKLTFGEIDGEAHRRVAYGKCRGAYLASEKDFQQKFVAATGGLSAIGFSRASQPEGKLDPDNPTTFMIYSSRSGLDGKTARLGVLIANGLEKSEQYWKGAVVLDPGETNQSPFGRVIVWPEGDKIARLLVNIRQEAKIGALVDELSKLYGKPSASDATKTTWKLASGRTASLDLGAAMVLVVE